MPTLPNMGLITPTLDGDSGTWDDKINAAFALVDAHDHTSGKGVAVPVSGMNINADLPMAGFGLTNLSKVSFTPITAPASGSKNLFVDSADSELYWRSAGGANVKLTDGSTINMTLVGGIVGDYASVGAEVAFDDANKRYTFKDQSSPTKKWARIASGPVRLYEYNTTVSNYVELASPSALAAPVTITMPACSMTLPAAVPATDHSVMAFTAATPTVGSFIDPATFVRTTSGIQGYAATAPFTVNVAACIGANDSWVLTGANFVTTSGSGGVVIPLPVPNGAIVTAWETWWVKTTNASTTIIAFPHAYDVTGTDITFTGTSIQSNAANNPGPVLMIQTGLSFAVPFSTQIVIVCSTNTVGSGDTLVGASITYYMPVP